MTMERKNRDQFDLNSGHGRGSFQEHDERIRGFRRSHAEVAMVNAPRCDQATLIGRMQPLHVSHPVTETGGSRFLSGTADWSALVPVLRVARYKLSQN